MGDTVKTKWFEYNQNNSGGSFDIDDEAGIGVRVWIEAADESHADQRAESLGIYFNGVDDGMDCPCCGDRWGHPWDSQKTKPTIGNGIDERYHFIWHHTVYLHPISGPVEKVKGPAL